MKEKIKIILTFGEMSLRSIIKYLYCAGCIVIAYIAFHWARAIYLTNFYDKEISYMEGKTRWYTTETVNNLPLSILGFIAYVIVALVIWKLICELLYIIFERIGRK
ncbi:hypothetical protein I5677_02030 [Mobilitalea sibirica]|uniref:Uncharacterized protein n=1 Tax=Mobilitalea sibirica TaxID=1462919 RepID=A0A8J7KV24_9FIRM|nr:hypothetical protein [Mobilitalea sibirica]MBH1939670.1 hypothetical protein [Mobilitalea sibirica]